MKPAEELVSEFFHINSENVNNASIHTDYQTLLNLLNAWGEAVFEAAQVRFQYGSGNVFSSYEKLLDSLKND